jgi:glycosyltransferase involved in cell wall biosynthesis
MQLSVIISSYNRPDALARVLAGYAVQDRQDFELVVADDGSDPRTAEVIAQARADTRMQIRHVWHEDRGFRKTVILNRAIGVASGDYLLFTDGDCIPRADLVAVHYELAAPGYYVAGGYLKLPAATTAAITEEVVRSGRISDLGWLRAHGWRPGRRALRMVRSPRLGRLLDLLTPTATHFHGNNAATWREALLAVNGFEGEMGYGGLDRALGYRLDNLGVSGRQARYRAVCFHLHHERPYKTSETMQRNREILDRIRRQREVRARSGIAELPQDPSLRIDGEPAA